MIDKASNFHIIMCKNQLTNRVKYYFLFKCAVLINVKMYLL